MITEFTCGIYQAKLNAFKWRIEIDCKTIAIVEPDGLLINFTSPTQFPLDDLIEIAVLMNNIKRQYKQLQNN